MNYLNAFIIIFPIIIAGIVHAVVIKKDWLKMFAIPIDFGRLIFGKPIFGKNKTFRGFIIMIVASIFSGLAVINLTSINNFSQFNLFKSNLEITMFYAVSGLTYCLGELPNSFVKRRFNLGPGDSSTGLLRIINYFFDQSDSVIAIAIIYLLLYRLPLTLLSIILILGLVIHCIIDFFLYLFNVKKSKWNAGDISVMTISIFSTFFYFLSKIIFNIFPGYISNKSFSIIRQTKKERGLILTANHFGILDSFMIVGGLELNSYFSIFPIRIMVHDRYIDKFWKKIFLYPLGCFSTKSENGIRSLDLANRFLERRQSILIFPEGKITKKRGIIPKVGCIWLAVHSSAKVLPVYITYNLKGITLKHGSYEVISSKHTNYQPYANLIMNRIYSLELTDPID